MTPEIPMEALRVIAERHKNPANDAQAIVEHTAAVSAVAAYVEAVDAAKPDEDLAWVLLCAHNMVAANCSLDQYRLTYPSLWKGAIAQARAARAHIAKEQQ